MDLSSLETRYVDVPVIAPTDVTSSAVAVAFVLRGKPVTADWQTATWATNAAGQTVARILVGPDNNGLPLAAGHTWYEWVKVTASPEIPIFCAGSVTVT